MDKDWLVFDPHPSKPLFKPPPKRRSYICRSPSEKQQKTTRRKFDGICIRDRTVVTAMLAAGSFGYPKIPVLIQGNASSSMLFCTAISIERR